MLKQCSVCGAFFEGHKHKKTCSSKCAHRAQAIVVQQKMMNDNPMKKPDVAKKMSTTRSQRFKDDPQFKELVAAYTRKAWADGKYDNVKVGQCKWYDHARPDGTTVKLQGTWEVVFARWLDAQGIRYDAHRGRIKYHDAQGTERSYYPDFYVIDENCYYDVKGVYFNDLQEAKFELIRKSNPTIDIKIIDRQAFKSLGIDVIKESKMVT
jgi:hypothetical protein